MTIAAAQHSEGQFSGNSAQKDRWEHCKVHWQPTTAVAVKVPWS